MFISFTLAPNLTGLADSRPINPVLVEIEFSTKTSWATWNVFYGQSDSMTAVVAGNEPCFTAFVQEWADVIITN